MECITYLPIEQKIKLVDTILNDLVDEDNVIFTNPIKQDVLVKVYFCKWYIKDFEMKETIFETYDEIVKNRVLEQVLDSEEKHNEYYAIANYVHESVLKIEKYRQSIMCFLEQLNNGSIDIANQFAEEMKKIDTPEVQELIGRLKDVINSNDNDLLK